MATPDLYLGLDVGGTHTDAVLIGGKGIISHYKAVTDHSNLLLSVRKAIEEITVDIDRNAIRRINLSTTLSTNAIVEDKTKRIAETGANLLIAGDLGCLMNMAGKISREGRAIEVRHVAEVLAGHRDAPPIGGRS